MKLILFRLRAIPRWIMLLTVSIVIVPSCFIGFIIEQKQPLKTPSGLKGPISGLIPAQIFFAIDIISADPISRTFTLDWYPTADCALPIVADIYLDPGYLDISSPSYSSSPPYPPAYHFNNTATCEKYTILKPVFRTTAKLLESTDKPSLATIQRYPRDVYAARFRIHALNNETGAYIALNLTRSFGAAVNFDVTLSVAMQEVIRISEPKLALTMRVERSKAIKIFVYSIAFTNCLIAGVFLVVSMSTFIYPEQKIYSEMFVVPVTVLFAFISVRANLPGAPAGFGATIDIYSILPLSVALGVCSPFLVLKMLHRRICDTERENTSASNHLHTAPPYRFC